MPGYDKAVCQGIPFHGEFSAADPTTTTLTTEPLHRFSLYLFGTTAATTVDASDQVIITDVEISQAATTVQASIYDGGDNDIGAGELIVPGQRVTQFYRQFTTPHWCQVGSYPKLKCPAGQAGQTDAVIRGVIRKAV